MRLISWNIAGRVQKQPGQVEAVAERSPDVVALQEITLSTGPLWRSALPALGLPYVADTVDLAVRSGRRYAVLIASRWPLRTLSPQAFDLPWQERLLSVTVAGPGGTLELHNTYIPTGASKAGARFKLETLEGLYTGLACAAKRPRILCGDFITPQAETERGELVTFAQTLKPNGEVRPKRTVMGIAGTRWDSAERSVLRGLAPYDLSDVYRQLHGVQGQDVSWYAKNRDRLFGFRLDHVFAAQALNPIRCRYLHPWREQGLSDHAAMEVLFRYNTL